MHHTILGRTQVTWLEAPPDKVPSPCPPGSTARAACVAHQGVEADSRRECTLDSAEHAQYVRGPSSIYRCARNAKRHGAGTRFLPMPRTNPIKSRKVAAGESEVEWELRLKRRGSNMIGSRWMAATVWHFSAHVFPRRGGNRQVAKSPRVPDPARCRHRSKEDGGGNRQVAKSPRVRDPAQCRRRF